MQTNQTPNDERRKQHTDIKTEIEKRLVANSDNFDKAILTYSSAGLALSLGFLKDFVPIGVAVWPGLLYGSWLLFVLAIVLTVISFPVSQRAQLRQLYISRQYNIDGDDTALSLPNRAAGMLEFISYTAGTSFVLALAASTLFVAINLDKGSSMTKQRIPPEDATGAANRIPQAGVERGAPVPILQPVQAPVSSVPQGAPPPGTAPPIPTSEGGKSGSH